MHRVHGLRKPCTRPYKYVHIKLYLYLSLEKMVHLPGVYILESCILQPKYAHRVQGVPLISNTGGYFDKRECFTHTPLFCILNYM